MPDHAHHYTVTATGWTCTVCGAHTHVYRANGLCACGTHIRTMADRDLAAVLDGDPIARIVKESQ